MRSSTDNVENRTQTFAMRPEQAEAVDRTMAYYRSAYEEGSNRTPKFLWNAKMRFGKTFASYELAKKMGFTRVLILTFKPAVQTAWREDLMTHVNFEGWQFSSAMPTICRTLSTTNTSGGQKPPHRLLWLLPGFPRRQQRHRRHQGQQRVGTYHQLGSGHL